MKNILLESLLIIAVAFGVGWYQHSRGLSEGIVIGNSQTQKQWDDDKIARGKAQATAVLKAVAANDAAHALDVKQTQKVIADYENTVRNQKKTIADYRRSSNAYSLRIPRSAICDRPAPAGEAPGAVYANGEGASETVDLPAKIASDLRDLTEDDDTAIAIKDAKIDGLQNWIIDHGFYGDPPPASP